MNPYTIIFTTFFIYFNSFSQNKLDGVKAENSVTKYLSKKNKNYNVLTFGEFFNQTYSKEVQNKLKTKKKVKYSIVHTYTINNIKITEMYFHLDEKFNVIGQLSSEEMGKINTDLLKNSGKMDSIMNNIMPNSAPPH